MKASEATPAQASLRDAEALIAHRGINPDKSHGYHHPIAPRWDGRRTSPEKVGSAKKISLRRRRLPNIAPANLTAGTPFRFLKMKAKIIVTPKKAVLDPQGKTVENALAHLGYRGVTGVHVGKYIEIDLAPGTDKAAAQQALNEAAHKFLSNPIIEDYKLEIE